MAEPEAASNGLQLHENRSSMLSRHQLEIKQLQNKEIELKRNAAKGSKAEQKAKKKLVEEEVAKLSSDMKARHADELASLGFVQGESSDSLDGLVRAIAGITTSGQSEKVSKGQKRRDKKAQKEAEREQRIQEEQDGMDGSQRSIEDADIKQKLKTMGLEMKEIKPDGHCMYRAVEDQLKSSRPAYSYKQLRSLAATYMRENADFFMPFIAGDDLDPEDENHRQNFEDYCNKTETSTAWGGQLELEALAHALKRHIRVISKDLPPVEMGKEYQAPGNSTITVCYHRHAFGLGEHYNSVIPLQS